MSNAFAQHVGADRRLMILTTLQLCGGYKMNEHALYEFLNEQQYSVSKDQLMTDLTWLAEQGLITFDQVAGVHLATLTQRGLDVQAGRARVPGVARPRPAS